MKGKILLLFWLLTALPLMAQQPLFNLTPRPVQAQKGTGRLVLPATFAVGTAAGLPAEMAAEADRFVAGFNAATGYAATVKAGATDALITVAQNVKLKDEGYTADITDKGIALTAKTPVGLYYAFQTVKKLLPPNVMAGVRDDKVSVYDLPIVKINDQPRFGYRGFMLDVARHFFTVDEVKRMLDVMSYYKLNRFHWHLSDDQGWRIEIKKYPRLTTVGATAPNSRFTSMTEGQYWINRPYGPYFYTQDEIRDVVAYAKARHIEIIPEIDMPGHFSAALAAYPQYSCSPNGSHTVQTDGGIYSDVMNVADPAAVQFAKDILAELIDLFPYEYINIGGDECPDNAWRNNALCQARYKELGLTNYRQLQSHFIKEISDFVVSKGRKIAIWNEGITATGADTKLVQQTGALVYCWTGPAAAAQKAKSLGLPNIYTPWGPYYINRRQSSAPTEPVGAGDGTDDVKKTYAEAIPAATDAGVQGTFWTEHVSDREYMEYLALPRLIAIAEAGWTQQGLRNFEDFRKRMSADTVLLNYGGYRYCKYHMLEAGTATPDTVMPKTSTATARHYYRIVTRATGERAGRCVELLRDGSPLIATYQDKGAEAGRLWTNAQAAEGDNNYDAQWWAIEEDPARAGHFAIVNKAQPGGSLNPDPTKTDNTGRWTYDNAQKHYAFTLGSKGYGQVGQNYYYSIASDNVSGKFLNASLGGQGYAVNVYGNPADGNGGLWEWQPAEKGGTTPGVTFRHLEKGATYRIACAVEGFDGTALVDEGRGTALRHSTDAFAADAWTVTDSIGNADGTQTVKLRNVATGRYVAATADYVARTGRAASVGATGAAVTIAPDAIHNGELRFKVNGASLFPLPAGTVSAGSTVDASADAARLQGATWMATKVVPATLTCVDEAGNAIITRRRSLPAGTSALTAELCPVLKGYAFVEARQTAPDAYTVAYKRVSFAVTLEARDDKGAIISREEETVGVGETFTVKLPSPKYYKLAAAQSKDGDTFVPQADSTIVATYTTDAITGVGAVGDIVTKLEAGNHYLIYDAVGGSDADRAGYRRIVPATGAINKFNTADELDPTAVWTLEARGANFLVGNDYLGLYVPALAKSQATTAAKSGVPFTFKLNADGTTFNVKGSNGLYWDGLGSGDLVGWDKNQGHPIRVCTFFARPYYTVSITCKDAAGKVLATSVDLIPAGAAHALVFPEIKGYAFASATGNETYDGTVEGYLAITATYADTATGIGHVTTDGGTAPQGLFDLQGRRLKAAPATGVYILNGKKIFIR